MKNSNERIVRVVSVSFEPEHYELILETARDLDLSVDSVLRAVCNAGVRFHFERIMRSRKEISGDA